MKSNCNQATILAAITFLAFGLVSTPGVAASASEEAPIDSKTLATANAMALPNTYLVTLTLADGNQTLEFSTVTAMRHVSLAPAESGLRFRGRLWLQPDGRELLDFSIDLGDLVAQEGGSTAVSSAGHWGGSTYVESGRPIRIAAGPESSITVTLKKQERSNRKGGSA